MFPDLGFDDLEEFVASPGQGVVDLRQAELEFIGQFLSSGLFLVGGREAVTGEDLDRGRLAGLLPQLAETVECVVDDLLLPVGGECRFRITPLFPGVGQVEGLGGLTDGVDRDQLTPGRGAFLPVCVPVGAAASTDSRKSRERNLRKKD